MPRRRPSSPRCERRCRGGRGLWPDPAAARCSTRRGTAASTSMARCCRAGAARRRSSARSWPAMPRPASAIMQMEAGLDTGPVLLEGRTPIDGKTAGELTAELAAMGARLMVEVLADLDGLSRRSRSPRRASPTPPRSTRPRRGSISTRAGGRGRAAGPRVQPGAGRVVRACGRAGEGAGGGRAADRGSRARRG